LSEKNITELADHGIEGTVLEGELMGIDLPPFDGPRGPQLIA
jgi:hypothetical protein